MIRHAGNFQVVCSLRFPAIYRTVEGSAPNTACGKIPYSSVYFTQSFPALVASLIEQETITFSEDSSVRLVNRELDFLGSLHSLASTLRTALTAISLDERRLAIDGELKCEPCLAEMFYAAQLF